MVEKFGIDKDGREIRKGLVGRRLKKLCDGGGCGGGERSCRKIRLGSHEVGEGGVSAVAVNFAVTDVCFGATIGYIRLGKS